MAAGQLWKDNKKSYESIAWTVQPWKNRDKMAIPVLKKEQLQDSHDSASREGKLWLIKNNVKNSYRYSEVGTSDKSSYIPIISY
jgi:hypothetical protein